MRQVVALHRKTKTAWISTLHLHYYVRNSQRHNFLFLRNFYSIFTLKVMRTNSRSREGWGGEKIWKPLYLLFTAPCTLQCRIKWMQFVCGGQSAFSGSGMGVETEAPRALGLARYELNNGPRTHHGVWIPCWPVPSRSSSVLHTYTCTLEAVMSISRMGNGQRVTMCSNNGSRWLWVQIRRQFRQVRRRSTKSWGRTSYQRKKSKTIKVYSHNDGHNLYLAININDLNIF